MSSIFWINKTETFIMARDGMSQIDQEGLEQHKFYK
jgi:hypothetical protein